MTYVYAIGLRRYFIHRTTVFKLQYASKVAGKRLYNLAVRRMAHCCQIIKSGVAVAMEE